jgi:hypothetical protein
VARICATANVLTSIVMKHADLAIHTKHAIKMLVKAAQIENARLFARPDKRCAMAHALIINRIKIIAVAVVMQAKNVIVIRYVATGFAAKTVAKAK